MLNLLALAVSGSLAAVDVVGMPPQIDIIRRDAAERGWRITCEGRSGEETVVRLTFPPGGPAESASAYFEAPDRVGSSAHYYYRGQRLPEGCDYDPVESSSSPASQVLGLGPLDITTSAATARSCGFTRAFTRRSRREDLPGGLGEVHDDWLTLDAGEDIASRNGPLICFVQVRGRSLGKAASK